MFNDKSLATNSSRQHIELMLRVARSYYLEDKTQAQIAQDIGYSRPTVSRLLKESRDSGMVHISISHELEPIRKIERQLEHKYGLQHVRVATVHDNENASQVVPKYAAALFCELCKPDSLITVSNGRAVAATVHEMPIREWPKSNVAQMIGSLSPDNPMIDSPDICRMLASKLGGTFTSLPAPMILSNAKIASSIRKEPQIATALALGGGADIAIVGVGTATEDRLVHIFDEYVDRTTAHTLCQRGVIGHICGHLIDAEGNLVPSDLYNRTISINLERLRRIPMVIGVAWGTVKVNAIHACLSGHLISALATDQKTAEALLAI